MIPQGIPDGGEGASEGGRAIAWVWEPAPRVQKPHTQEIAKKNGERELWESLEIEGPNRPWKAA